jgi:hypothetical protein
MSLSNEKNMHLSSMSSIKESYTKISEDRTKKYEIKTNEIFHVVKSEIYNDLQQMSGAIESIKQMMS